MALQIFWVQMAQTSFQTPDLKLYNFRIKNLFHVKLHNILHKISCYFQYLDNFSQ